MELSAQLELRGILLDLNWSRRTENVLADKLSNGFFEDFDPLLRVEVDLKEMNWIILHHLLKWAPKLFEEIQNLKTSNKDTQSVKTKKSKTSPSDRLRIRQPWNEPFVPHK